MSDSVQPQALSVEEAQKRFYDLAERVSRTNETVFIAHPTNGEQVALVSRAYLTYLLGTYEQLQKEQGKPIKLECNVDAKLSDEELMRTLQAMREAIAQEKPGDIEAS